MAVVVILVLHPDGRVAYLFSAFSLVLLLATLLKRMHDARRRRRGRQHPDGDHRGAR